MGAVAASRLPADLREYLEAIAEGLAAVAVGKAEGPEQLEDAIDAALAQAHALRAVDPYSTFEPLTQDEITARRMKELRAAAGASQEGLAEHMQAFGFSWGRTTTMDTERGTRRLGIAELYALALLFRVPMTDLLLPVGNEVLAVNGWQDEHGETVSTVAYLDRREALEVIVGRGGKAGRGGLRWSVVANAVPEGVDGPAREIWRKRTQDQNQKGSKS